MPASFDNTQPSLAVAEIITQYGIYPWSTGSSADPEGGGYLSQIRHYAGTLDFSNYETTASGQMVPIYQNQALFSLLGTTFGGNGQTIFGLPHLNGRVSVGTGQGPGLWNVSVGDYDFGEAFTPAAGNLPASLGGSATAISNLQSDLGVMFAIRLIGGSGALHLAGEIAEFALSGTFFIPAGYVQCAGQMLNIADYPDLYAAIGTTYGGNGTTTFALPDLRGRTIVGASADHALGQAFGSQTLQITNANLPVDMGGSGSAISNYQPSLALNYMIATSGIVRNLDNDDTAAGEIVATAATSAGTGFLMCQGQVLQIADYPDLFAALGTTYGGDGSTTFALPDMRDHSLAGTGSYFGPNYVLGQTYGTPSWVLTMADIPALNYSGDGTDNTMYGGDAGDTLSGLDGADRLVGGAGADTLIGGADGDVLKGGTGADTMRGGSGNDTYVVDNVGDTASEESTGVGNDDGGTDLVRTSVDFTLGAFLENLTIIDSGAITGTGNGLDNHLFGNDGNNTLNGMGGNDLLNGGAGIDAMFGGSGDDTYVVDNPGDTASEESTGAGNDDGGTDLVRTSIDFTLGAFLEDLRMTGSGAITGTGNGLDNHLFGNDGNNTLNGMDGNDLLNGGAGTDAMFGGSGNDTYVVDNAGDTASEESTGAGVNDGGTDFVRASVSFTLGAFIENLALTGTEAIDGTGNALSNRIVGNDANNILSGLDGNDFLLGGLGDDTLVGGAGDDTLTGGDGADTFVFAHTGVTNGRDRVADFASGTDHLSFTASDYGFSAGHILSAGELSLTGAATGALAQFVYNPANHVLSFDSNGNAPGGMVAIAVLLNGAAPTAGDFIFT